MITRRSGTPLPAIAIATLLLTGTAAHADIFCPRPDQQPLRQPQELRAAGGVLDTTLRIQLRQHSCVPFWDTAAGQWTSKSMTLRTYGFPLTNDGSQFVWGFPGPTLRLRKASPPGLAAGDRLRILLDNRLPISPLPEHECAPACPPGTDCSAPTPPACCSAADVWPECFHGENTTNLHFHGSHVSPQSPQDYVLLQLLPPGEAAESVHAAHSRGLTTVGTFQYSVDPLRRTQPEGTHWYHPHKHGSVSLQVLNGMAGALLIEGPFDDFLKSFYQGQGGLTETLMVVQQVDQSLNFFQQDPNFVPPHPLVNGQANPVLTMRPGEIQRWRFVGATMQGSAQLEIGFPSELAAKQVAMDGIQLAPANYSRQPLLQGLSNYRISPGNRADFLVQAPQTTGTFFVTHRIFGELEESLRHRVEARDQQILQRIKAEHFQAAALLGAPPLLTVVVQGAPKPMTFPSPLQWPPMPSYLADIPAGLPQRTVTFEISGGPGQPQSRFTIDGKQFDPACVDFTLKLGTAEEWTIQNNAELSNFHVFHIHTNPFQVVRNGTQTFTAPYVWQDSITLPPLSANGVAIRQRFEEFTGEYVLHCHFLGHEDRGMMLGVQTVCPEKPDSWGKPRADGSPECVAGNYIPAAPQCPTTD